MNDFKIRYYNFRDETAKLPFLIGRKEELAHVDRIADRRINNNVLIVGPDGIGKTAFVRGWARTQTATQRLASRAVLQFDTEHLLVLRDAPDAEDRYAEAFAQLPESVLIVEDLGREVYRDAELMQRVHRLYKPLLSGERVRVVCTLEPHEHAWLEREHPAFVRMFETIILKQQSVQENERILARVLPRLNAGHRVIVPEAALSEVIAYAERFPMLGQMPLSAIRLLDEAIAYSAVQESRILSGETIARVVESKTGVPRARLTQHELRGVKELEDMLNARVVHQQGAIAKVASTLQRAKLGLRNPQRPLGSFLLLGPSGVGKTETAKSVAELLFGRSESFLRFDMSEFQQDHTVQRLIGAPAGYIGYEGGGALTNALKRDPYSLILLDEIEKAHPKVFDIFLQVLDDGRLTSGQNETVDAKNAVVMATSNAAVPEILDAVRAGADVNDATFLKEVVLPILAKTFRLEFLNRFDSIVVFTPLTVPALERIARLEIAKMEKRLEKHGVRFEIQSDVLRQKVECLADARFGARPVKRFVEETCETLLVESLLNAA
jgi:ATP-dependent Clp protease ATP-binding subunit ClpC